MKFDGEERANKLSKREKDKKNNSQYREIDEEVVFQCSQSFDELEQSKNVANKLARRPTGVVQQVCVCVCVCVCVLYYAIGRGIIVGEGAGTSVLVRGGCEFIRCKRESLTSALWYFCVCSSVLACMRNI